METILNGCRIKTMRNLNQKVWIVFSEIAKWIVIVYLFWPLVVMQSAKLPLWRMMLGVLLLVIFVGKLFYDYVLDTLKKNRERSPLSHLISMVVSISIIAVIIAGLLMLFGYYALSQYQQVTPQE